MACVGHVLWPYLPAAHESSAEAALPLEALPVEAISFQATCLQATLLSEALPPQAMRAITRATYDHLVQVPRRLHRPARERVFIRMVIPA
jgi:hypothetical protein